MCGIIGYTGSRECAPILIGGLRRLEYRGYDSAGVAVISRNGLELRRAVGKVDALAKLLEEKPLSGVTGLGHTRWATHGRPSEQNSHPHTDCDGKLVVVHNGIIENYVELKEALIAKGHRFASETDTEVLAHLVEEKIKSLGSGGKAWRHDMQDPLLFEGVRQALREVRGSYAIGIIWSMCPDTIIAARNQSPLVIGHGEKETFVASDVTAVLEYTRKVSFLNDGEIALLKSDGARVFTLEGKKVEPQVSTIQWDRTMAEKGGYRHFMLKEIHEQPDAVEDTLRGRLFPLEPATLEEKYGLSRDYVSELREIRIVACGTAYHAGLAGKYALEHFTGVPVSVEAASEYRYRDTLPERDALMIAISQSGETADTLAALRQSKRDGMRTLAVCNVVGSTLSREADFTFYTYCGPEIGVASTKAFVAQLISLYMLALQLGVSRGKLSAEEAKRLGEELLRMPSLMRKTLAGEAAVERLAKHLAGRNHFLFLGRNANFPIALEGALKIKEISYVHAEGFAGGEMKHGPIAIIEEGMPILGIAVKSRVLEKMLSNLQEAKARDAFVVAIVTEGTDVKFKPDWLLTVPEVNEYFSPAISVIPLQLFAYHIAALKGCDIDQPRNLAKSVTVE